jgi:hypothetical protein
VTPLVFRPSVASAGRSFWIVTGTYLALFAILCASLATWRLDWPVAVFLYVVLVTVMTAWPIVRALLL